MSRGYVTDLMATADSTAAIFFCRRSASLSWFISATL